MIEVLPREWSAFADDVGSFIETWGFKNIQGRIWAVVYLAREPLSAIQLARLLGVSKALISLAMKELLDYDVLLKHHSGDLKRPKYIPNPDLPGVISGVLRQRELKLIRKSGESLSAIAALRPTVLEAKGVSAVRLAEVNRLIQDSGALLETLLRDSCGPPDAWLSLEQ